MDGKSLKRSGERGRNRTYNLLIKSQLLCQLSYAPTVGIWLVGRTKNYSIRSGFSVDVQVFGAPSLGIVLCFSRNRLLYCAPGAQVEPWMPPVLLVDVN